MRRRLLGKRVINALNTSRACVLYRARIPLQTCQAFTMQTDHPSSVSIRPQADRHHLITHGCFGCVIGPTHSASSPPTRTKRRWQFIPLHEYSGSVLVGKFYTVARPLPHSLACYFLNHHRIISLPYEPSLWLESCFKCPDN